MVFGSVGLLVYNGVEIIGAVYFYSVLLPGPAVCVSVCVCVCVCTCQCECVSVCACKFCLSSSTSPAQGCNIVIAYFKH